MKKKKPYLLGLGIIGCLLVAYFIADSVLYTGVKPRRIADYGFQGNYFVKKDSPQKAAIILIGGGQWGDYWAQQFSNSGFVGLSLSYTGEENLPKLLEEINLEYFEFALKWLKEQAAVDPNKILVMGASRNAELALLIASIFPNHVSGVIAYAPSSVSWSNTVLPYNSDELKPSWKYKGTAIPYIPMEKITGNQSNKIDYIAYWKKGLSKTDYFTSASIKVENTNGPILLFSGKDDLVWPSSLMADRIEQRIVASNFKHSFQNIQYENAGHLISTHPEINSGSRTGTITIDGKEYELNYGGTTEGDKAAKQDATRRLMKFINEI